MFCKYDWKRTRALCALAIMVHWEISPAGLEQTTICQHKPEGEFWVCYGYTVFSAKM
jgi:hypothetical protein